MPHHDRLISALDRSAKTLMMIMWINILQDIGKIDKPLRHNTCQTDYGYMCIWTDCQTKSTLFISM